MLHYSGLSVQFTQYLDAAIQISFERGCRWLWNDAIHCNSVIPLHDNKGFFLYLVCFVFCTFERVQTDWSDLLSYSSKLGPFKNTLLNVAETKVNSVFMLLEGEAPLEGALDEQRRQGSNQRHVEELCCCTVLTAETSSTDFNTGCMDACSSYICWFFFSLEMLTVFATMKLLA